MKHPIIWFIPMLLFCIFFFLLPILFFYIAEASKNIYPITNMLGWIIYYNKDLIILISFILAYFCSPIGIAMIISLISSYIDILENYQEYKHRNDIDIKYLKEIINELNEKIDNINPLKEYLTSKTRNSRNEIIENIQDFNKHKVLPKSKSNDYLCETCKWSLLQSTEYPCLVCYDNSRYISKKDDSND